MKNTMRWFGLLCCGLSCALAQAQYAGDRKEPDGNASPSERASPPAPSASPVRVEIGYTRDDNVNRTRSGSERLSDDIFSVNVSKSTTLPVTAHSRVLATGFLNAEKPRRFSGLERIALGVQGEFQYRTSAEFFAPTFGVFARASLDEYDSELRSGQRYTIGMNLRQSLTDRIELFAALARNWRNAESTVFDGRDYAARFHLDYSLGRDGALYLGGEYRRGDAVTSAPDSPAYGNLAKAEAPDDAYAGRGLVAYRYAAKTVLWTLGYNRPLGPRNAIDLSWRRAEATPTYSGVAGGSSRYYANQFSIAYLMRF